MKRKLAFFACAMLACDAYALESQPPQSAQRWRDERCCGPVSLYVLAKLADQPLDLEEIIRIAPPSDKGVSLRQLEKASDQLGFPVTAITFSDIGFLRSLTLPAIAHVSSARDGHYVVVLGVEAESVIVADGIHCQITRQPVEDFQRLASGHLLVPDKALTEAECRRILYVAFVCLIALTVFDLVGHYVLIAERQS
ncbi:cysteine peptidase family C39 domain-containing protein [Crateriforma conspicua]|uniref:Peptidase C39 family protein n=1 Tax=Crateriforma conspicua TaxID=2527996 RepID=A0A5C5Y9G1_9PLAN|nr:cysteine peptidase family C39 domain-containing protein [Crateriforma conspicua]TWT72317.1 Peptidase C39 family protein [Crateriforma conspicua]